MPIETELSPNLIEFFRVNLFDSFRIAEKNLILSNNYIVAPVSGLNEQYLPAYARWCGTSASEAARAAVTVLFTINRPIIRRLHADPFGDTKSWCRRLVINHASSPSVANRDFTPSSRPREKLPSIPPTNCVQVRRLNRNALGNRARLSVNAKKRKKKKRINSTPT